MAERLTDTMIPDPPSDELLAKTGLTREEYQDACIKLRRKPNLVEMGIFGAMWSEHCCYKSSKRHLLKFPVEGKRVLQGPGENAGVMDLGNNYAVVFKIESHNHPSAVEPFQGAATGVGGIIRDIFAMGARPIGLMNSLRFGNLAPVASVGLPPAEAEQKAAELAQERQQAQEAALAQAKQATSAIPWTAEEPPYVYSLAWMTNLRRPLFSRGPVARKAVQVIKSLHGDMAEILGYCLLPDQVILTAYFPAGDETSPVALVSVLKAELGRLVEEQVPPGKPLWETGFREHRKHDDQELSESIRRLEYTPVQRGFVTQIKDYPHVSKVWKYGVPWLADGVELEQEPLQLPYCGGVTSEQAARNRFLLNGVVSGIAHYGNCIGIPTVGGEVCFDPSYTNNCLVNAMCIGIARKDSLLKGITGDEGNTALIVGAKTGRDGVQGATFASVDLPENYATERPAVQVGDPFMEKLLLEATLEILRMDGLIGLQDFGAAGLTCSSVEMAARSQAGMQLDLDKVPQRAKDLSAYEMMLSESQERMMVVVEPGKEQPFINAFKKWGLTAVPCGEVLGNTQLKVIHNGELVADLPNGPLANEAPDYNRPYAEPEYYSQRKQVGDREVTAAVARILEREAPQVIDPELVGDNVLLSMFARLLAWPGIASKELVYQQYDYMVRTNTLLGPGAADAAVLRVKETGQGLAMSTDGSARHVQLDPRLGGARAVLESARNVLASGAEPLGVTNCLNFGNPEKPDRMWQFVECIEGMATALRELELPITGGNVSLYNETAGRPILPTPVIGMVGLLEDADTCIPSRVTAENLDLYLLGELDGRLDGSTLLFELGRYRAGELAEHNYRAFRDCERYLLAAGEQGALAACHDVADGGLLTAVLELSPAGAELDLSKLLCETYDDDELNKLGTLYGEEGHQWVLAVPEKKRSWVRTAALHYGVPLAPLGKTSLGRLTVKAGSDVWLDCPAAALSEIHRQALPNAMGR